LLQSFHSFAISGVKVLVALVEMQAVSYISHKLSEGHALVYQFWTLEKTISKLFNLIFVLVIVDYDVNGCLNLILFLLTVLLSN
jgi:hypothetical protein